MQLEIGSTYQGKVKRITNYGAFIAIQPDAAAPETVTGMVHISEISNRFVQTSAAWALAAAKHSDDLDPDEVDAAGSEHAGHRHSDFWYAVVAAAIAEKF